jgi:hypothetical protein
MLPLGDHAARFSAPLRVLRVATVRGAGVGRIARVDVGAHAAPCANGMEFPVPTHSDLGTKGPKSASEVAPP